MKRTIRPKIIVENAPPMNPSHVFFGDSLMSGVLPKAKPNTYDIMSQQMINATGTRNLKKFEIFAKMINYSTIIRVNDRGSLIYPKYCALYTYHYNLAYDTLNNHFNQSLYSVVVLRGKRNQ